MMKIYYSQKINRKTLYKLHTVNMDVDTFIFFCCFKINEWKCRYKLQENLKVKSSKKNKNKYHHSSSLCFSMAQLARLASAFFNSSCNFASHCFKCISSLTLSSLIKSKKIKRRKKTSIRKTTKVLEKPRKFK